jgi:CHC2-type zinc finger protein
MSDCPASPPLLRLYKHRPGSRSGWSEIRGRIDPTKVAAALLGPPVERRGLTSGSLGWYCPFHVGTSPSFRIFLGEAIWSCTACGAGGDSAALVMRLKGIGFRDAIAWLDEQDGLDSSEVVAPDDHAASRAMPVRALRLDPYAIGEWAVIMEFDADVMGKVADRAARPG